MVENPQNDPSPGVERAPVSARAGARRMPERAAAAPATTDREADPVTDWLLQRDDLDDDEFSVLFGVHKLRSRPGRRGWIGHGELCRSTGLGAAALGGVLGRLRRRGLLGMVHHPVKSGWARYLVIVQG